MHERSTHDSFDDSRILCCSNICCIIDACWSYRLLSGDPNGIDKLRAKMAAQSDDERLCDEEEPLLIAAHHQESK